MQVVMMQPPKSTAWLQGRGIQSHMQAPPEMEQQQEGSTPATHPMFDTEVTVSKAAQVQAAMQQQVQQVATAPPPQNQQDQQRLQIQLDEISDQLEILRGQLNVLSQRQRELRAAVPLAPLAPNTQPPQPESGPTTPTPEERQWWL